MCSETSEAVGITWEHAQLEFQNFLKIRIPLLSMISMTMLMMSKYSLVTILNADHYSKYDAR